MASGVRVVYMGTKQEPDTVELWAEYAEYDNRVLALAKELAAGSGEAPLAFVDVSAAFNLNGNPIEYYKKDQLHLSAEGYSLWDAWAGAALADPACVHWRAGECQDGALAGGCAALGEAGACAAQPACEWKGSSCAGRGQPGTCGKQASAACKSARSALKQAKKKKKKKKKLAKASAKRTACIDKAAACRYDPSLAS